MTQIEKLMVLGNVMDQINLNKKVYAKNQYERVIDTNFSQLANTNPSSIVPTPTISVSEFFQYFLFP